MSNGNETDSAPGHTSDTRGALSEHSDAALKWFRNLLHRAVKSGVLGLWCFVAGVVPLICRTWFGPDEWDRWLQANIPWGANLARSYVVAAPIAALGLVLLWLAFEHRARQRLAQSTTTARTTECTICKQERSGFYCKDCNAIVADDLGLTASVFMVQHRAAIVSALATLVFGSFVTFTWQSTHEYWQAESDAALRRHALAEKATTHLAMFRAALWEFATDCLQRKLAAKEPPPQDTCTPVYRRIMEGYVSWSWVMPDFIAEVKSHDCAQVDRDLADSTTSTRSLNVVACELLQCDLSMRPLSDAFIAFVNAYARYVRCEAKDDLRDLGEKHKALESVTLRMGCAATIAAYRGADKANHSDTTGYCSMNFLKIENLPGDSEERKGWCERTLRPEENSTHAWMKDRDWENWFNGDNSVVCKPTSQRSP